MSDHLPTDGIPTDEQLRRIERGVQRRIDLRRRVARRIAGGSVAVVLVVGGFALLRPLTGSYSGGSGSTGGFAAGSASRTTDRTTSGAAVPAEALPAVRCHGAATITVIVDPAKLPGSALIACATAQRKTAALSGTDDGRTAGTGSADRSTPSPSGAVLCRATGGALSVWPGGAAACATHGLEPYRG